MHAFERKVGGDENFVALRHTQHGCIVANPEADASGSSPAHGPPDHLNLRLFR
jgi:hypothetical protein